MSIDYQRKRDEDGEPVPCDNCGYDAPVYEFEDWVEVASEMGGGKTKFHLCEICSCTHLSSPMKYPSQFDASERKLFQGIAWIGNRILGEIQRSNSGASCPLEPKS